MVNPPLQKISLAEVLTMERFYRATLINSLSGFKSLNLLGTVSSDGRNNLSLVNSVVHVGAHPPMMGMVVRPHTVPRHSLENLLATGQFTLNHVQESFFPAAHQTSANYPPEVSEFKATGLSPWFAEGFSAPYVTESELRIGLEFKERHEICNGTIFVVGEVKEIWLDPKRIQADGYFDHAGAGTLTVAGLDAYHRPNPLARMAYAKPEQESAQIPWTGNESVKREKAP